MTLDTHTHVPPEAYFEEQAAMRLLVPRAKVLAALADAYGAAPAAPVLFVSLEQLSEHSDPDAEHGGTPHGRYLPARKTPAGNFTHPLYALPPAAPAVTEALGAPGEVVKAIREYLGVHPDLQLGGQVLDSMALELSRIALDYPADLIGALALEELMQLGYTVEAGAILPPRDLPEQACQFFGVLPVGRAPAAVVGPALTPVERQALEGLCAVAAAAHHVADDSPYDGSTVAVESGDMEALGQALDKLEGLPDDQPGYLMGPASKAEWALRRLLDVASPLEAPEAPAAKPGGMITVPFDLVAAACSAIDKKRDAPKILAELHRYTTGDRSRARATAPIPTSLNIAPRGKSWLEGKLIEGTDGHPTRQAMEEAAAPLAPAAPALSAAPIPVMPRAITAGLGLDDSGEEPSYCVMVAFRQEDDARYALSILSAGLGAATTAAAGNWIATEEVARLVRELDVALHGEADAAPQAALCDIVGLTKTAARQLGRPVLGAVAALASDTALLDAMTRHRIALVPEFEGPWDAEIYNDDAEARSIASGNTPREALRAALAAQAKDGGAA